MGTTFSLKKYYMDVVTETGQYFIGYSAKLKFGAFAISYGDTVCSAELEQKGPGPSLDGNATPCISQEGLSWVHPKLGIHGDWQPLSCPVRSELLQTREGCVDWDCFQPHAFASVKWDNGREIQGYGYCECLTMTIAPWNLGLKTLLWGRFVSRQHSVIWIEWRGQHERRQLYLDGGSVRFVDVTDERVVSDLFSIRIEPVATIRNGYLGPGILSKVPAANKLAPARLLRVFEDKKLARGHLTFKDGRTDSGWIIHEKVDWPDE